MPSPASRAARSCSDLDPEECDRRRAAGSYGHFLEFFDGRLQGGDSRFRQRQEGGPRLAGLAPNQVERLLQSGDAIHTPEQPGQRKNLTLEIARLVVTA